MNARFFFEANILGSEFHFFFEKTSLFGSTCQYRLSSAAAVQQIRVGALSPMPSCLGIGGHRSGSRQGHPQKNGA